jgi:hypothetical protein
MTKSALRILFAEIGDSGPPSQYPITEELLTVGLWERRDGCFCVHDYLDYNPSRAQVLAERDATKRRVNAFREARRNERCNGVTDTVTDMCNVVTPTVTPTVSNALCNTLPVPVPVPVPVPESRTETIKVKSVPTAPRKKTRGNGSDPDPVSVGAWIAYSEAYVGRYHQEPIRDAQTNALFCQLVKRLGDDASAVASFYVMHDRKWYVEHQHDPKYLIQDAAGLHTQWKNGRTVTSHAAQEVDRLRGAGDMWRELIDEAKGGTVK